MGHVSSPRQRSSLCASRAFRMSRLGRFEMVIKAAIHAAAVAVYLAMVTLSGVAQTSFAALGGKVTDEQGGVLPGVTVTVRQLDTNTTRTGVSDSNGQYY